MGFPYYVVLIVAICISVLVAFVAKTKNRRTMEVLFAFYIIAVLIITLLIRTYDLEARTMLNPFRNHVALGKRVLKDGLDSLALSEHTITEILLNILLFEPFGFMTPSVVETIRSWWKVVLFGLCFSLFIEVSQLLLHMGCFDTADLMHNTIGAWIGYGIWWKWIREKRTEG